jgi:hypothetical protein
MRIKETRRAHRLAHRDQAEADQCLAEHRWDATQHESD